MKVALLSDCYLPRLGGIEVQVHDLARHLMGAGHEVEVFTATVGTRGASSRLEDGIRVHRHPLTLPGGFTVPVPVNPLALGPVRSELAAGGFDVAHVHMGVVSPFATDMAGLALRLGMPTAITWHCVIDRSAPLWRGVGYARRWAEHGAALSAVSRMAASRISAIAGGAEVEVLWNGIDAPLWQRPESDAADSRATGAGRFGRADAAAAQRADQQARQQVRQGAGGGSERRLRIVSAQRMVRRKRPFRLLEVLRDARALIPAETILEASIVGDGPWRTAMQKWLDEHDMGWVQLPGRVTREALRELHWRSDIYLSAARLEAFGIAALEARVAGSALVVLAGTGSDDFVTDGVNGLLAADDAGLASALARLALDPGLLDRIRTHNGATPPAQDWPAVIEATLAEYGRARDQLRWRGSGAH